MHPTGLGETNKIQATDYYLSLYILFDFKIKGSNKPIKTNVATIILNIKILIFPHPLFYYQYLHQAHISLLPENKNLLILK